MLLGRTFGGGAVTVRDRPRQSQVLSVTLAANYSTIDNGFDFDLFDGVGQPQIGQRLAAAITDFGVFGQIDQFLACRQVRVVSSLGCRTSRLLSALLFGRRRISALA